MGLYMGLGINKYPHYLNAACIMIRSQYAHWVDRAGGFGGQGQ